MKVRLVQGDITRLDVDAIVNAANSGLLSGGGADYEVFLKAFEGSGVLESR